MKLKLNAFGCVFLLIACICLAACSSQNGSSRQSLIQQLEQEGVSINTVGETVTIILPSDEVFNSDSANLAAGYPTILKQVAQLLKTYILVSVQVSAYSDLADPRNLKALTTKQAQVIANTLWDNGVDARLIYAVGGASSDMVVKGGSFSQRTANRRVEITFRYYLPVSYYD